MAVPTSSDTLSGQNSYTMFLDFSRLDTAHNSGQREARAKVLRSAELYQIGGPDAEREGGRTGRASGQRAGSETSKNGAHGQTAVRITAERTQKGSHESARQLGRKRRASRSSTNASTLV